jgi:hypothetical protein
VHSELDNFHTISGACRVGRGCVTDVTDGLNFTPQTVSFSQFQNRAISKSPGFETGATERAPSIGQYQYSKRKRGQKTTEEVI